MEVFAVIGGFWNGFQWSLLPCTQEKSPSLQFVMALVTQFQQIGYCKSRGISFPRGGYKMILFLCGLGSFALSHFLTLPKQDSKCWVAVWEGPHGKELKKASVHSPSIQPSIRPPVRSWILPTARVSSKAYTSLWELWDNFCPDQLLDCSPRDPELRGLGYTIPSFLTHRNYEVINIYCFQPLSFGDNLLLSHK